MATQDFGNVDAGKTKLKQLKTSTIQTVTRARVFFLGGDGDGSQVKKEIQDLGGGVWQSFAPSKLFAPGARKLQLQKETTDLHLHQLNWGIIHILCIWFQPTARRAKAWNWGPNVKHQQKLNKYETHRNPENAKTGALID